MGGGGGGGNRVCRQRELRKPQLAAFVAAAAVLRSRVAVGAMSRGGALALGGLARRGGDREAIRGALHAAAAASSPELRD
eukprot:363371-Chlamydomonas_euryale.AAC.4